MFRRSPWWLLALSWMPSLQAAGIPPFCARMPSPPPTCDAPAPAPCEGACSREGENNPGRWNAFWERCPNLPAAASELERKRYVCSSPKATELHILYYNPTGEWLCCAKNPFVNGAASEGEAD